MERYLKEYQTLDQDLIAFGEGKIKRWIRDGPHLGKKIKLNIIMDVEDTSGLII